MERFSGLRNLLNVFWTLTHKLVQLTNMRFWPCWPLSGLKLLIRGVIRVKSSSKSPCERQIFHKGSLIGWTALYCHIKLHSHIFKLRSGLRAKQSRGMLLLFVCFLWECVGIALTVIKSAFFSPKLAVWPRQHRHWRGPDPKIYIYNWYVGSHFESVNTYNQRLLWKHAVET